MPLVYSPQVCCCFQAATPFDLAFSSPVSHSSILATAAEGEGSAIAGLSMKEDASYSPSAIREDITATTDLPSQLLSPLPVTDTAIDGPSRRSLGTGHTEHCPPDAIVVDDTAVSHTHLSDVNASTSRPPTPVTLFNDGLPIGMLLSLDSAITYLSTPLCLPGPHPQMPAPAASGSSRSWDPSASVEGEESAKSA